jgi:hypothetical protein
MPNDVSSEVNEYLDDKDADGFLYSGPINRDNADRLVKLIDGRADRHKNVCLFISTFGGDPNAAYRIGRSLKVNYARGKIFVILGGYCKSAGTLLALCANEIAFGCMGELGPLDTQIDKPNEILSAESGLDLLQALEQVTESSFESFEQQMVSIIRHSNGVITTKVAAEIASSLTVGIFNPISAQIDPLRLGVVKRAIEIGLAYGNRLKSDNVKQGTVKKLVHDYPAHGFVIDQSEAGELFENVRGLDANEARLLGYWEFILRVPAQDGNEFISDLRTIFSSQSIAPKDQGKNADESMIGVKDAEPDNDQRGTQDEHGTAGAAGAAGTGE